VLVMRQRAARMVVTGLVAAVATGSLAPRATFAAQQALRPRAVLLQVRPRIGDTLHMRLDLRVETVGTTRVGTADTSMAVTTSLRVHSRTVVQRSDPQSTIVLALTDSVAMTGRGAPADANRWVPGRPAQLRIFPDGATETLDPGERAGEGALAHMPATLPRQPVAVGDSWTHEMQLPSAGGAKTPSPGAVRAVFHLDSVSRTGDIAYITVKGSVARDGLAPAPDENVRFSSTGSVDGSVVVDRRRGWVTDSRMTVVVRSTFAPPPGSDGEVMHFRMKITQRLRAVR